MLSADGWIQRSGGMKRSLPFRDHGATLNRPAPRSLLCLRLHDELASLSTPNAVIRHSAPLCRET